MRALSSMSPGLITDCLSIPCVSLYLCALALAALTNFVIPLCSTFAMLATAAAIFGFCMGESSVLTFRPFLLWWFWRVLTIKMYNQIIWKYVPHPPVYLRRLFHLLIVLGKQYLKFSSQNKIGRMRYKGEGCALFSNLQTLSLSLSLISLSLSL